MNNEICRVSLEERNYDYPSEPHPSMFSHAAVVAQPDIARIEARRNLINLYCDKQNRINKAATKLKAEQAMAKQVEASK